MFAIGSKVWPGLSKLIEEAGEAAQVAGKLIAVGGGSKHWDGSNLTHRMIEELADLGAAIDFVIEANDLPVEVIMARRDRKLARFRAWHGKQQAPAGGSLSPSDRELLRDLRGRTPLITPRNAPAAPGAPLHFVPAAPSEADGEKDPALGRCERCAWHFDHDDGAPLHFDPAFQLWCHKPEHWATGRAPRESDTGGVESVDAPGRSPAAASTYNPQLPTPRERVREIAFAALAVVEPRRSGRSPAAVLEAAEEVADLFMATVTKRRRRE